MRWIAFIGHILNIRIAVTEPFFNSVIRYNSNSMQFTCLKCTIQWLFVYGQSCVSITTLSFRTFSLLQKEILYLSAIAPRLPSFSVRPSPRQVLIYFSVLWICLFWTFYIDRIRPYVIFCDWIPLLSIFSGFTHVVVSFGTSFLFIAK